MTLCLSQKHVTFTLYQLLVAYRQEFEATQPNRLISYVESCHLWLQEISKLCSIEYVKRMHVPLLCLFKINKYILKKALPFCTGDVILNLQAVESTVFRSHPYYHLLDPKHISAVNHDVSPMMTESVILGRFLV